MPAPVFSTADFTSAILRLMPRGPAWPKSPVFADGNGTIAQDAPIMVQTLAALAPTYARLSARDANLLTDAFPATAVELLPEWEASLGLPDPCAGIAPTTEARQGQVVARLTARGKNQSAGYFINFAATLGYAITITQFTAYTVGHPVGTPVYGAAWANAWQVNAPTYTIDPFRAGDAVGVPLATFGSTALQCELQRLSPAHTTLLFNYS